jgi:hypothetical protein
MNSVKPKQVPLVIYRDGERIDIGTAHLFDSGNGINMVGCIKDTEVSRELGLDIGAISLGIFPTDSYERG